MGSMFGKIDFSEPMQAMMAVAALIIPGGLIAFCLYLRIRSSLAPARVAKDETTLLR